MKKTIIKIPVCECNKQVMIKDNEEIGLTISTNEFDHLLKFDYAESRKEGWQKKIAVFMFKNNYLIIKKRFSLEYLVDEISKKVLPQENVEDFRENVDLDTWEIEYPDYYKQIDNIISESSLKDLKEKYDIEDYFLDDTAYIRIMI